MKYVVEVREPIPEDEATIVARLTAASKITTEKARALLSHVPGAVTRPVTERQAKMVANLFRQAGLNVVIHPHAPVAEEQQRLEPELSGQEAARDEIPPDPSAAPEMENTGATHPPSATPLEREAPPLKAEIEETEAPEVLAESRVGGEGESHEPAVTPERQVTEPQIESPLHGVDGDASGAAGAAADLSGDSPSSPERSTARERPHRRIGLRRKFLVAGIVPALLTITFALIAVAFTLQPALRTQLLDAAHNPAVALSASVEGFVQDGDLASPGVREQLGSVASLLHAAFKEQDISFVVIAGSEGEPLAGWYGEEDGVEALPEEILTAVRERVLADAGNQGDVAEVASPPEGVVMGPDGAIEVASQIIQRDGKVQGAVVFGISDRDLSRRVRTVLLGTLVAGVIPVIIAIIVAIGLTRALTANIFYLVEAADQISRGDLERTVESRSNDELGDLSAALERMRVSLQEGLERLRRRPR